MLYLDHIQAPTLFFREGVLCCYFGVFMRYTISVINLSMLTTLVRSIVVVNKSYVAFRGIVIIVGRFCSFYMRRLSVKFFSGLC